MLNTDTNRRVPDQALALAALAWVLRDEDRAYRLLDTTGLTPELLRAGVEDGGTLGAVLGFLEAHEPDLIACADDLGVTPDMLVAARRTIES